MKTEIALNLADMIIAEAKKLEEIATRYAVNFAEGEDPANRVSYQRYSDAAKAVRSLHAPICRALHSLEAMIPDEAVSHD